MGRSVAKRMGPPGWRCTEVGANHMASPDVFRLVPRFSGHPPSAEDYGVCEGFANCSVNRSKIGSTRLSCNAAAFSLTYQPAASFKMPLAKSASTTMTPARRTQRLGSISLAKSRISTERMGEACHSALTRSVARVGRTPRRPL